MAVSDLIARFILDTLNECNGSAELQRSMLAERFNCVPSQINYVISTRFSPERGYLVESRRAGGGYIRITRVQAPPARQLIMHTVNSIGGELDLPTAAAFISNAVQSGAVAEESGRIMLAALSDNALRAAPRVCRDALRASLLKYMLLQTISDGTF